MRGQKRGLRQQAGLQEVGKVSPLIEHAPGEERLRIAQHSGARARPLRESGGVLVELVNLGELQPLGGEGVPDRTGSGCLEQTPGLGFALVTAAERAAIRGRAQLRVGWSTAD